MAADILRGLCAGLDYVVSTQGNCVALVGDQPGPFAVTGIAWAAFSE